MKSKVLLNIIASLAIMTVYTTSANPKNACATVPVISAITDATVKTETNTSYIIYNHLTAFLTSFSADANSLSYSYILTGDTTGADAYLAVYDTDNKLKYVSKNQPCASEAGNFSGCTPKLMIWDSSQHPLTDVITEVSQPGEICVNDTMPPEDTDDLWVNSVTHLTLNTILEGDTVWSVSDSNIASITQDGILTATAPGALTVFAQISGYTFQKTFTVRRCTFSGSASCGDDTGRPADSTDYLKAVDGDLNTYFDGTENGWIQYDYGLPFKLHEIRLAARNGMSECTIGGRVQASNDGIAWTDLYQISAAIPADSYTIITASSLLDNHAYRYYRYTNPNNMTNIAEFILYGHISNDTPPDAPEINDIQEFTDSFESNSNIFGAENGTLDSDGNKVFDSGLDRFGKVFAPVKATASSSLTKPIELTHNELFRITFTMFTGWESNGRDHTFAIKDKDGNEIAALYITNGGYTLSEIRIGGANVLDAPTIAQSRSNPGTIKAGANGWNATGQPFVNTVGYNKTVEIRIDGAGNALISASGGMYDTTVTGTLSEPVSIASIELTGSYKKARGRVVSYDNLDADVITYSTAFDSSIPSSEPVTTSVLP